MILNIANSEISVALQVFSKVVFLFVRVGQLKVLQSYITINHRYGILPVWYLSNKCFTKGQNVGISCP